MIENAINSSATFLKSLTLNQWGIILGMAIGVIAVAISKHALTISKRGILPDIEFRYELKQIESELKKFPIQRDFLNQYKDRYGDMYSHFILFNGGNGKASNIKVEYNWIVNGEIGGVSNEAIRKAGHKLLYHDYLFPGWDHVSVPALEFRSTVFEEAERILLRVRYKDSMGGKHCECVQFVSIHGERGFNIEPESHNYCGPVKRWVKRITRGCVFSEGVCSVDGLIPILEDEGEEKRE